MCGIVGIVARADVGPDIYNALLVLQHRGQNAAGIATSKEGRFFQRSSRGLVRDVFRARHKERLRGGMGIGHLRYPTAGAESVEESQPFYVNSPYGIARAHNGNLTNAEELRPKLFKMGLRHINTGSDSEVLLNVFAEELQDLGRSDLRMGDKLARRILREWPNHDIDVVIPIPDTSRTSALQLASAMGLVYQKGFMKSRFIGRTFIMSGQPQRESAVRQKLNPIAPQLAGKNVLLVDDSIVRGTSSMQIIRMARRAGAKKVYFATAAPPVRHPNVYGIDMPSAAEMAAYGRSEKEVEKRIGADRLFYQSLEDLIASVTEENRELRSFDCSIFDGNYVTGDIDAAYLAGLEASRGGQPSA